MITSVIKNKTATAKNFDRWQAEKRAVTTWLAEHPKEAKKIAAAREKANRLRKEADALLDFISELGIQGDRIGDNEAFIKAGGLVPVAPGTVSFDSVMAQLAAADEKAGAKILKDLGIEWK